MNLCLQQFKHIHLLLHFCMLEARCKIKENMIKLSDYLMKFLVNKGVTNVFMLPGGGAMHLDDSLGKCKELSYTCFLHEQAISIAAEAYGQFTNTPGVALVTSGPGSTNTVTGVTAAYFDSTPVVFISGQAKRADLKADSGVRQMGPQEVDITSIVSPVTKYAATVLDPQKIKYHLEKAWHLATTGRMGPVWIDIPLDIQAATIDESQLESFWGKEDNINDIGDSVDKIVEMLNSASRPLLLAGNGIKLADALEHFYTFIENYNIPTLLTWKAIDFLDYEHELNFGSPGIMGCRSANFLVQNCDLLLIIGSRLDTSVTAFDSEKFGKNAVKVMVDIDECEIKKTKGIDHAVVADAGHFLRELNLRQAGIKRANTEKWLRYARDLKDKYPVVQKEYYSRDNGVNLYVFTDELFKQLKNDDIITPESSGAAGEVTYQAMKVKKGQKVKNAAGLGAMGFGLPYAIGAAIANKGRRTVLINGDGAFQLNIQELETVTRLSLPIKMFIFDNGGYASIMATQDIMFGGRYVGSEAGSGLTLPSLEALAKAYNIRYEQVETHNDLELAIERTLSGEDPVICRVRVGKNHITMPKVQAMKLPDGGMISKPLEDMFPYLAEAEIAENMIAEK
jgi:acetolactate synthase-1/2/3 large subunit